MQGKLGEEGTAHKLQLRPKLHGDTLTRALHDAVQFVEDPADAGHGLPADDAPVGVGVVSIVLCSDRTRVFHLKQYWRW